MKILIKFAIQIINNQNDGKKIKEKEIKEIYKIILNNYLYSLCKKNKYAYLFLSALFSIMNKTVAKIV